MRTQITAPTGMYGLAVEPWTKGEIYAVAADWAQASAPVVVYGEDGWTHDEHGRQVADFRHNARAALESVIREAIEMGGDEPDDDEVDAIMDDAVDIGADCVTTAGEYRDSHSECTDDLVGHDGETLDDDTVITVRGEQYMVGTDESKVDEWIDLY